MYQLGHFEHKKLILNFNRSQNPLTSFLRHKSSITIILQKLICLRYCPIHTLWTGGKHDFRTKQSKEHPPFLGHRLGHGQDTLVSLCRANKSQGNPRVSRGRFDHHALRVQTAVSFGGGYHGRSDPILDACQRVEKLSLQI